MTKDVCQRLNISMPIFRGDMDSIAVPLNSVIVMPSNESRIDLAERIAADHKGIMFLLVCGYFNRITV